MAHKGGQVCTASKQNIKYPQGVSTWSHTSRCSPWLVERAAAVVESLKRFPLVLKTSNEILSSVLFLFKHIYFDTFHFAFACPTELQASYRQLERGSYFTSVSVGGRRLLMNPLAFLSRRRQNFLMTVCSLPFKGRLPFCVRLV